MKVSKDFILRQIADEYMLVPIGQAAAHFNGFISMNEIGHFIFQTLEKDITEDQIVDQILSEYDINRDTAFRDLREFLQQLRDLGALIEG